MVCGFALVLAPAAEAAQRFAAPGGSGPEPCQQSVPCSIVTATNNAAGGDEVVLLPGDYGSQATPLTDALVNVNAVSIHGADGQPRPRIFTTAPLGLQLTDAGASLRQVEIRYLRTEPSVDGGCALAGTVEDIVVRTGPFGNACGLGLEGGSVRNSLFASQAGFALSAVGNWSLRGVTAVSASAFGLNTQGTFGGVSVSVTNSILRGGAADVRVNASFGESVAVTLDHSNYTTTQLDVDAGVSGSITPAGSGTNQTAAPLFVDASAGDLRQAAGSPTLDAGVDDVLNGPLDFEGDRRSLHGRTDIGADERPFAPDVATGSVSGIGDTEATLAGLVTPWDFLTSWRFEYGTDTAYGLQTADGALAPAVSAQAVSATLTGLAPSTTYHYRLSASGVGGTATGTDATFTTAPLPPVAAEPKDAPPVGRCFGRRATITATAGVVARGTAAADVIVGTRGPDRVVSSGGRDLVCSRGGGDKLSTGAGDDRVSAGPGADRISTGAGADQINPGSGRDRIAAGPGNDRLGLTGNARDTASCGLGRDRATADRSDRLRGCERVNRARRGSR